MNIPEPNWQTLTSDVSIALKEQLGLPLWQVITDTGSLTDLVKKDCRDQFSVVVLQQSEEQPDQNEQDYLQQPAGSAALIRNVLLCDGETPLVFAHSVMPLKTLEGAGKVLGDMGNRPLGAELFSNPLIRRGDIQVAALSSDHPLFIQATSQIETKPALLWGRRSAFFVGKSPLLVCEFFLPTWRPACPST